MAVYKNRICLLREPIEIKIIESVDSERKKANNRIKDIKPSPETKDSVTPSESPKPANPVGAVATKLLVTIGAIILKYFVIVDILTNFFSKINVELSPKLKQIETYLKNAQIPSFGSIETTSPIDDGGSEKEDDYNKLMAEKKANKESKEK